MKTIKLTAILLIVALFSFNACKKEPGFEGKNKINGTVTYKGVAVKNAIVSIAFDKTAATTVFDATTVTDKDGKYNFSALSAGDYFITAEFTDAFEVNFKCPGAHVKIGEKKGDLKVDLALQ